MDIMRIVKEIVYRNGWLSGKYDFDEGDIMAIVTQQEKFLCKPREYKTLKGLFNALKSYDGVFKYRELLFFNDDRYGTFVYHINNPDRSHYIEHLSLERMSFERFKEVVEHTLQEANMRYGQTVEVTSQ
jgi:hypothetical protein